MNLQDATLLITGANRGVGKAYVEDALTRGVARIYAAARDPETLAPVVALDPARVVPVRLDITDATQIAEAARTARDVTVLINNAGALSFGGALEVGQSAINRDMAVNHDGLREMTRAFAPVIEANGGGAVVNMLSLLSFLSAPGFSAYNASKAAAWSMAMSLRAYLRPRGVLVVNAFPGGIDTEMLAGIDGPKDTPQAVAKAVLDGLEAGEEDVYPATASEVYAGWRADQKGLEAAFAAMM